MPDFKIEYSDALADNVDEKIHQGNVADEASNGDICNYKKFYFFIKDDSDTNVVGALTAYTAYSEIYVDNIWVDPNYHKNRLGRPYQIRSQISITCNNLESWRVTEI